jgi:hypothetical protein
LQTFRLRSVYADEHPTDHTRHLMCIGEVMFHSSPFQHRSISRDLSRILILILVVIACVAFFLTYLVSTWRAKRTLEMKADEYIVSLTEILTIPLWTLDRDTITVIGKTCRSNGPASAARTG